MLFVSIFPLILFIILVFWNKLKLIWTSLISLLVTLILVYFVWQINPSFIKISFLKGTFVATDIFLIIFGALFFLEVLQKIGIIKNLNLYLEKISSDYRIQVILLAWFLESFLEGTAGFGTPSTVVAPLLVGLGLSPVLAASIALLGNSASVVFGAAGAPIRIGFAGLDIIKVPFYSALFNLAGFIVPIFMLWIVTIGRKQDKKYFFEALPFAIFSGFAFLVPSVLTVFLGQEFPSILGSVIGFLLVFLAIKLNLFMPGKVERLDGNKKRSAVKTIPLFKVVFPYILLIILLIVAKFLLGNIGYTINFGIKHTFSFFNPGIVFVLAAFPIIVFWVKDKKFILRKLGQSFVQAISPFLIIASISVMVQLMIYSGQNNSGNNSLLQIISENFETPFLPLIAPIVGAFGSFMTGSATVSNIMFGSILQSTSQTIGLNSEKILALQLVGGAAGNMIALADILPALIVVNLKGKQTDVIKKVIVPCSIYVLLVGLIGLIVS